MHVKHAFSRWEWERAGRAGEQEKEEAIDKRARDKTASAPPSVQRGRVFFLSSTSLTLHHYRIT